MSKETRWTMQWVRRTQLPPQHPGAGLSLSLKWVMLVMFAFASAVVLATDVFAITAPTSTTAFAYDLYDIAINKVIKGPIGFVAGTMAIVFGAVLAIKQEIMGAIPAILGGAMMLKADSIIASLGATF